MSSLLDFIQTHEEAFRSRTRLASLYSDFRLQRSNNPDGYAANSSAWLRALSAAASAGLLPSQSAGEHDHFVLRSGEEITQALQTPQYGRPLALGSVIHDAVEKRELIPLAEFLGAKRSIYAKSWVPTPSQVVNWGLKQLGLAGGAGDDKLIAGNFVVMGSLESATKTVLQEASKETISNTSRIFTRELFAETFLPALGEDTLSSNDVSVLLTHISRDHLAAAYDTETGVVKFKSPSETQPSQINQEDINIASTRSLISSLEVQVSSLDKRIADLNNKARDAVAAKNTITAKTVLRSKKLAETTLQQRSTTLQQLEEVYAKIEQASDQVEIVRVMETAGQTLKTLNERTGGVDKVQDVMEGLREEMLNADEIGQVLNETGAEGIDEGEVEDELEEMEKVEREKREAVERREREQKEAAERQRQEEEAEITRRRLAELEASESRHAIHGKPDTVREGQARPSESETREQQPADSQQVPAT